MSSLNDSNQTEPKSDALDQPSTYDGTMDPDMVCEYQAGVKATPEQLTAEKHFHERTILKTIALTLNESIDLHSMLQTTLEKLLELTNLQSGWIFLAGKRPDFELVADYRLPPALMDQDKRPMTCSDCFCLRQFWSGKLNKAVNIIQCERLHIAAEQCNGDTMNLSHHATIPITTRGVSLGIMNISSPGKEHFSLEELTLLQSVAFQIGSAVERTRLYEERQQQAVNSMARFIVDYYANMNEVTRFIWKIHDCEKMLTVAAERIGTIFGWPFVALVIKEEEQAILRAVCQEGEAHKANRLIGEMTEQAMLAIEELAPYPYKAAIPLCGHHVDSAPGYLLLGRHDEAFSKLELELLEMLSDHISLALERMQLYEEWQDMLLAEERNRLARDLHDSVNQKLFSLSLMASGMQKMLATNAAPLGQQLSEVATNIGQYAKEALSEMRTLIWQLRPYGDMKGMLGSLKEHAESLGIHVTFQMKQSLSLPREIEETLWRIGLEALNNIHKHAHTNRAWIKLEHEGEMLVMKISDQGRGFALANRANEADEANEDNEMREASFGITSMRERASEVNGVFEIASELGFGTVITVKIPLGNERRGFVDGD